MKSFLSFINETLTIKHIEKYDFKIIDVEYFNGNRLYKDLAIVANNINNFELDIFFIENEILDGHYSIGEIFLFILEKADNNVEFIKFNKLKNQKLQSDINKIIKSLIAKKVLEIEQDGYSFTKEVKEINLVQKTEKDFEQEIDRLKKYNLNIVKNIKDSHLGRIESFNLYVKIYNKFFYKKRWKFIEDEILNFMIYTFNQVDLYGIRYLTQKSLFFNYFIFSIVYITEFNIKELYNFLIKGVKKTLKIIFNLIEYCREDNFSTHADSIELILSLFYDIIIKDKELSYLARVVLDLFQKKAEENGYNIVYSYTRKLIEKFQ